MDCGPTCLRMVAKYYGRSYTIDRIKQTSGYNKDGVSLLGISEAGEKMGFRTRGARLTYDRLTKEALLPCILHWNQNHFVVMMPRRKWTRGQLIRIADPAKGIITCTRQEFLKGWSGTTTEEGEPAGNVLLLEPTSEFYEGEGDKKQKLSWSLIFRYLDQSRWQIIQVFIALLITALLQSILPFLTQSIVDTG